MNTMTRVTKANENSAGILAPGTAPDGSIHLTGFCVPRLGCVQFNYGTLNNYF